MTSRPLGACRRVAEAAEEKGDEGEEGVAAVVKLQFWLLEERLLLKRKVDVKNVIGNKKKGNEELKIGNCECGLV
jgi:hypothetical protein